MRERLEKLLAQFKEQQAKLSKKTKMILIIGLAVILVFAIVVTVLLNSTNYEALYLNMADQEVTEVSAKLTELGIKFQVEGTTIMVPAEQVDQMRATLASQGYPKSGLAYDTFKDNVDLMTTNDEKDFYKLADLQDSMAATIRLFDGVKEAVVRIALGEDKKYVKESEKIESSAAVTVVMRDGTSPSTEMARSIQRLVAFGVPGMKMENVVVIDGNGNTISSSGDDSQSGTAKLKRTLEIEIENSTKAKIMSLLEPVYGEEHIRITVTANVNVDKTIREIINYNPSTEDNKGVISKESEGVEIITGGGVVGGVPGAETNADIPLYSGVTYNDGELYYKDQKDLDYLVSQIKEQVQSDSGMLTDLTVSAAVDSDIIEQRDIGDLKELVANAAAIPLTDADNKVVIFSAKFNGGQSESLGFIEDFRANPMKYLPLIIGIVAFLIVIAVAVILLLKKKKKVADEEDEALENGVMSIDLEDIKDLHDIAKTREMELKDQIRDFADSNPEISAQLIKTWLKGGDLDD